MTAVWGVDLTLSTKEIRDGQAWSDSDFEMLAGVVAGTAETSATSSSRCAWIRFKIVGSDGDELDLIPLPFVSE
jgi:hypothetical protein